VVEDDAEDDDEEDDEEADAEDDSVAAVIEQGVDDVATSALGDVAMSSSPTFDCRRFLDPPRAFSFFVAMASAGELVGWIRADAATGSNNAIGVDGALLPSVCAEGVEWVPAKFIIDVRNCTPLLAFAPADVGVGVPMDE